MIVIQNIREFYFAAPEDFEIFLDHLGEMGSAYRVRLFAYTLMSSHIHLLRNRCGHFWERRYRACLVEDDLFALAALRYMDRNPVQAGIVEDPAAYA